MENTPLPSFLALETSDAYTSVALLRHGETLFVRESTEHNDHAEVLDVMIQEVLAEAGLGFPDLAAIGISQGPGSYTGLRIGYATVKGLCFATGLPMIAVPTLAALAGKMELLVGTPPEGQKCCFVPMIDARRMEVYTQTFLPQLQAVHIRGAVARASRWATCLLCGEWGREGTTGVSPRGLDLRGVPHGAGSRSPACLTGTLFGRGI